MDSPLVSIIMPAYNAQQYIGEAIHSALQQTYPNWELIIVNDGSSDHTLEVIQKFQDPRISIFSQENKGVSAARNLALKKMKGDLFCLLDADDFLPASSIAVRVNKFLKNPELSFVDGIVSVRDASLQNELRRYVPHVSGNVFSELVRLTGSCFFGPSWMIKKEQHVSYAFKEGLTHGEDLCFYLSLSKGRIYDYVEEEVLVYRKVEGSAMSNLNGLEKGYHFFYSYAKENGANQYDLKVLKKKIKRIVFLSYLIDGRAPYKAIRSYFKSFQ